VLQLSSEERIIAIDLGGTKIAAALVSLDGEIVCQEQMPTLAEEGVDAVISRLLAAVDRVVGQVDPPPSWLTSLAIAAAGAIDAENGIVTVSPNLPGWDNVPLKTILEEATGAKVFLVNDASAAALGEYRYGAGRGVENLLYITVSTGIGGGIVVNGRLYTGASGTAGEFGHMTIDAGGPRCNCGNTGCFEMLASGKAVAREAQKRISQGSRTRILELAEGEPENITAKLVAAAAQAGDAVALEVIDRAAYYLGVGLANLVNIFNPEMIVVGGGMAKMGDMLLEPARKVVAERAFRLPAERVRIVRSQLGDSTGLMGAVAYAQQLAGSV